MNMNQFNIKYLFGIIFTMVIIYIQMHQIFTAPIHDSTNNESSISAEELKELIMNSVLENKCEINQHQKDLCELCMRHVYNRTAVYLACCTNFDGIFNFCHDFFNYSFDDQQKQQTISATTNSKRFPNK